MRQVTRLWPQLSNAKRKVLAEWFAIVAGAATVVTVLAMWLIYLGERDNSLQQQRQQMVLAMLQTGQSEQVQGAKRGVSRYLIANGETLAAAKVGGTSPPPMSEEERAAALLLLEFYDDVAKCAEADVCDADLTRLWFRDDMCQYAYFYTSGIEGQLAEDYGGELDANLTRYCDTVTPD